MEEGIVYVATVEKDGLIHVLRQARRESGRETIGELLPGFGSNAAGSDLCLATAILEDCRYDGIRALRLRERIANLLVRPLISRSSWILTSEDVAAAVQTVEELEGWLWLKDGFYLDQSPEMNSDYAH